MLKRIIKAVTVVVTIVCLVMAFIPVQAFAVDPLSTAMMANAFAQAIAAYGASNGVAMTFDVSSTDGIGEGVHELWKDFRASTNESDDFDSVASIYQSTNPYSPQSVNIFGQTMQVVGISLNDDVKPVIDDFWNWLLSGPAEMVKVDNQYEFSLSQIGDNAVPLNVYTGGGFPTTPILLSGLTDQQYFESSLPVFSCTWHKSGTQTYVYTNGVYSTSNAFYVFVVPPNYVYCVSESGSDTFYWAQQGVLNNGTPYYNNVSPRSINLTDNSYPGLTWGSANQSSSYTDWSYYVPTYSSVEAGLADIAAGAPSDTIGVRAYDEDGIATIPDTNASDYVDTYPPIPLNIPWDETLYGDGTGTLTDAQTQAIANDVTSALETDGVVELVEEGTAPAPTPGEVYVPLLPVTLPSFNFNLSGIWHYVREWVSSLGAWFTTLFTIWSHLPYAMVVPVYATAVVVIVLGVYKRFFM